MRLSVGEGGRGGAAVRPERELCPGTVGGRRGPGQHGERSQGRGHTSLNRQKLLLFLTPLPETGEISNCKFLTHCGGMS